MRRLTRYEILVLLGAVLLTLTAFVGCLASIPWVFDFSLMVLLLLVVVGVMFAIIRIDRLLTGQKRTREEIYQVLYSLHRIDKWTETHARKTRDLLRENHQALLDEIKGVTNDSSDESTGDDLALLDSLTPLEEAERLRFNKIIGILDAQWALLEDLRQSVP